jgi:transposase
MMGRNDPICVQISGAQINDSKLACEMMGLLNKEAIKSFVGDKAYDTNKIRDWLKDNNIAAEIPNKRNRKNKFRFDKTVYKWRHKIENLFGRIKENRRLAMRLDKLDSSSIGFIALSLMKL